MIISTTLANQEIFIIQKILDWADRTEDITKVELMLEDFEGKPFHNLPLDELFRQVHGVLVKFKKNNHINNFYPPKETLSKRSIFIIDIYNKEDILKQYIIYINNGLEINNSVLINRNINSTPFSPKIKLLSEIPKNKKTKKIRAMAKIIESSREINNIDNFYLAKCISPQIKREDYKNTTKNKLDLKIKYRFRALRKYLNRLGYTIRFRFDHSKVIKI